MSLCQNQRGIPLGIQMKRHIAWITLWPGHRQIANWIRSLTIHGLLDKIECD